MHKPIAAGICLRQHALVLTWHATPDVYHRAVRMRHVLRSPAFPKNHFSALWGDDAIAVCSWSRNLLHRKGTRGFWEAVFHLGYASIIERGATAAVAMRRLEGALDKRSIEFFKRDDIRFEPARTLPAANATTR